MSALLIYALPGNERMADALAAALKAGRGAIETRHFPDGETYLRLLTDPKGRNVAIVATLANPDGKILPLLFAAAAARDQGAAKIGLVAPYLAYMRQDRSFKPGEAVSSRVVARTLSASFDWLATVDPHLHRYSSLSEIYSIPSRVVHAAPLISKWIAANVAKPFLIGPDAESEQWVSAVARDAGAPYAVLEKIRRGDRDVEIKFAAAPKLAGRTPVLVDDIISSGQTMLEAVRALKRLNAVPPVCVAVHGLFSGNSGEELMREAARVVTCNTIPHETNAMDVAPPIAAALAQLD